MSFVRTAPWSAKLAVVLGIGVTVVTVVAAWSSADAGGTAPMTTTIALVVVAATAMVLAGLLVTTLHKRSLADSAAADWRDKALTAQAVIASAPGHLRLDQTGSGSGDAAFEQFCNQLAPDDSDRLRDNAGALRQHGHTFRMTLRAGDGQRHWRVEGTRGARDGSGRHADMLWIEDVSREEAELKRCRQELDDERARCRRLAGLLNLMPTPVWLRADDLSLVWTNLAYRQAVEAGPRDEQAGQRELAAGALGDDGRALAKAVRSSASPDSQTTHLVMAGERRLMAITEAPIQDGNGRGLLLGGYAIDLTEVESAETDLEDHIAAHAKVLESLQTAIAIFGADKRLTFFNQAYVNLWGFDENWLDRKPDYGEILEDLRERRRMPEHSDFPAFKRGRLEMFNKLIEPYEEFIHLPDDTTVRAVIAPHPFGGLLLMMEDVTSRLALERSYNQLIAVQQETLDNLAEAIAVFGGDGRLRLSNPIYGKIWNLYPDDLEGRPHISTLTERMRQFFDTAADWAAIREALVLAPLERESQNLRLLRKDGSAIDYTAIPLPDGGVLMSFLDVTDSVKVETALLASNEALATADRLKSEFIANVSYQLRTPLNAIMGFAEMLDNQYFGDLNEKQREYIFSILDASQRLLSLINDILDLATIEAGQLTLERRLVDVGDLLRGVQDLTREWAGKQNLAVNIDCPDDIGMIEADERRLKQALFNLVSNAIKFTLPGGRIVLGARRQGASILLTVRDNGIGIPTADHERVFGRFERAHPRLRQSGVGLGLSLVKKLIELHGGQVEMVSEPGQGTTVSCILEAEASTVPAK